MRGQIVSAEQGHARSVGERVSWIIRLQREFSGLGTAFALLRRNNFFDVGLDSHIHDYTEPERRNRIYLRGAARKICRFPFLYTLQF